MPGEGKYQLHALADRWLHTYSVITASNSVCLESEHGNVFMSSRKLSFKEVSNMSYLTFTLLMSF